MAVKGAARLVFEKSCYFEGTRSSLCAVEPVIVFTMDTAAPWQSTTKILDHTGGQIIVVDKEYMKLHSAASIQFQHRLLTKNGCTNTGQSLSFDCS